MDGGFHLLDALLQFGIAHQVNVMVYVAYDFGLFSEATDAGHRGHGKGPPIRVLIGEPLEGFNTRRTAHDIGEHAQKGRAVVSPQVREDFFAADARERFSLLL